MARTEQRGNIESKSKRFLLLKKKIKFSWQMNVFMLREILYDWLGGAEPQKQIVSARYGVC